DFRHAARAQRVGCARPAERRLRLFPTLEERLVRPLRRETRIRMDLIQLVEDHPGRIGGHGQDFFGILYRFVHRRLTPLTALALACSDTQAPDPACACAQYRQTRGAGQPVGIKTLKLLVVRRGTGLNGARAPAREGWCSRMKENGLPRQDARFTTRSAPQLPSSVPNWK